jgi:hypothetical protein
MSRHLYLVFSSPVEGRESEYNEWYSNIHLRDVLKVPGFVAAQRFKQAEGAYLAVYEIESEDPGEALGALGRAAKDMNMSDALDRDNISTMLFSPITDRLVEE